LDGWLRRGFDGSMIIHTLIYSFPAEMPEQDRTRFFEELESLSLGDGGATQIGYQRHLPTPNDEHAPIFGATDVAQISFADLDAVQKMSDLPALADFITRWQQKFPYKLVWVNHESLL
jgi:hypothetical protein